MTTTETGTVKWFDDNSGYGFIERDRGGDIFVHYSSVLCEESECSLEKGNRVEYMVIHSPTGLQAQNVVVIGE